MELTRSSRPTQFEHFVGSQEHILSLRNDIMNHEFPQKLIFHGTPGTGKSSLALVASMALQCQNPQNGNPCLQCEHCKEILEKMIYNDGSCCNIHRYNMSDKTGIEDARKILEILNYKKPKEYNHTILILEEPQRMSQSAQDILNVPFEFLREDIIVFFVTTDLDALSDALESRSCVFHIKPPTQKETATLLYNITLQVYNITVPMSALELIAEYSGNIPRDSVKNLERVLKTGEFSADSINKTLGLTNFEFYIQFFEVVHRDIGVVSGFLDSLKKTNMSYVDFVSNLHIFMTDMYKIRANVPVNRYSKPQLARCKNIFKDYSIKEFQRLQALATQLAVINLGNRYQTERLAESLLYKFAQDVNMKDAFEEYFSDSNKDSDHVQANEAYQKREHEKFLESKPTVISTSQEVVQAISEVTQSEVKIVRAGNNIKVAEAPTGVIY